MANERLNHCAVRVYGRIVVEQEMTLGFHYICTLNSDDVPRNEFSPGFRIEDYIRLRLTDADVAGCLIGVRF